MRNMLCCIVCGLFTRSWWLGGGLVVCVDGLLSVYQPGWYGFASERGYFIPFALSGRPLATAARPKRYYLGSVWLFWVACVPDWVSVQLWLVAGFVSLILVVGVGGVFMVVCWVSISCSFHSSMCLG